MVACQNVEIKESLVLLTYKRLKVYYNNNIKRRCIKLYYKVELTEQEVTDQIRKTLERCRREYIIEQNTLRAKTIRYVKSVINRIL